jgi:hypothetical protein
MAGLNNNDIVQFIVVMTHDGQTCMNTFKYRVGAPSIAPDYPTAMLQALNGFASSVAAPYQRMLEATSIDVAFDYIIGQVVHPTRRRAFRSIRGEVGNLDSPSLPVNTAVHIERFGLLANRHNTGGIHLTGIPIDLVENSKLTAGALLNYEPVAASLANSFDAAAGSTLLQPVLTNRTYGIVNLVFGSIVQPTVRVMRRRTVGLGI